MIVRQLQPNNLETEFDEFDSFLTPADRFYIRDHFAAPEIEASEYRLHIGGAVEKPFMLRLEELQAMPAETIAVTLECAGNSRAFLTPQVEGAQWALGAVGNAEWTGVPLCRLLERAGLQESAVEVILEGADRGKPKEKPMPPGEIVYARSLPLRDALSDDVLIAWQMNGRSLTRDHGFPVRAVVAGHYGMASVKWLTRVHVTTEPFAGYWQTSDYAYWDEVDGNPVRRALSKMTLKSEIFRPGVYEAVRAGEVYTVRGAAWAGGADVAGVAVSVDGGDTWTSAEFLDAPMRFAWRRWRYAWHVPRTPGCYTLLSRAADAEGNTQANEHDENYGPYVINHVLPVRVNAGVECS